MRVLAILHGYPPTQNAGAEWMLHEMLKYLQAKGHHCEVAMEGEDFEGIRVGKLDTEKVKKADVIISHLKKAGQALNAAEFYHKPFVFVAHNSNNFHIISAKASKNFIKVVYNSEFVKKACKYPVPSIVIHPHVDSKRYKTKRGDKITLINLFERKGGKFFHELARELPEYKFLGVEGGYGKQEKEELPNVSYMVNHPEAKKIYAQTRILLMPSIYESYGRTAIEAMVNGIPVIAAPTPGLKECMGEAGIFCETPEEWISAIKSLDDAEYYKKVSDRCTAWSKEVEKKTIKELAEFEKFIR
jgi:glycosyltransferase involved in cell wall biosynthesis